MVAAVGRGPSVSGPQGEKEAAELPPTADDPLHGKLLPREWWSFFWGCVMLTILLPLTATTVASTVLWDALDRGFRGRPQDGVVMSAARWINRNTGLFGRQLVRNPKDSFVVNVVFLLGVVVPVLFFLSLKYTMEHGFSPYLCFAYHVFRLGPYFMNFAYCYTMCHKEGHSALGIFSGPLKVPLNRAFNWWIGLFYGVMPSSFANGHSINHHKYNNGPYDVVTTSDKPRDNFRNFVCYLPRWFLYSINVSTIRQFFSEGNYAVVTSMAAGSVYWMCWFAAFYHLHPTFAVWYVLFPVGENVLLLACINWTWHAFLNPNDPEDEFVGSITIVDGPINVLNEDYHVVHHQYPGAHWSTHVERYQFHLNKGEYHEGPATMFRGTHAFELFFLIILREYNELAKRFVDIRGQLEHDEKVRLLQRRLRTCWWGPRQNTQIELQGKELGNHDLGHKVGRDGFQG